MSDAMHAQQRQPGLFLSVEGIDGAGKSSHIEAMAQAFEAQGHTVLCTREPGGTPLGEKLRALLLHDEMDAVTEAMLAFAARRQHLLEKIVPALRAGHTVLCDRFTDATFAYQGQGRGLEWQRLAQMEQWAQTIGDVFYTPDCTIWFDVPAETAAGRLKHAREPDRFEAEAGGSFFQRVAQGYARRAEAAPQRFVRINSNQPKDEVARQILAALALRGYLAAN